MDYFGLVRRAWSRSFRSGPLWGLALVRSAFALVFGVLAFVMAMLFAMVVSLGAVLSERAGVPANAQLVAFEILDRADQYLAAGGVLVGAWLALGIGLAVFDVAAYAGMVTQSDVLVQGRRASFRQGMADGFRMWGRTAALYALVAMPQLISMLLVSLAFYLTFTLPLQQGGTPDIDMFSTAMNALSPLTSLMSLIALPLSVIVVIALRFALLAEMTWKPALGAAWRLIKANFTEVLLVFLTLYVVSLGISLLVFFALGVIGVPLGYGVFVQAMGGSTAGAIGLAAAGGAVLMVVLAYAQITLLFIDLGVYTEAWRRWTASPVSEAPAVEGAPA